METRTTVPNNEAGVHAMFDDEGCDFLEDFQTKAPSSDKKPLGTAEGSEVTTRPEPALQPVSVVSGISDEKIPEKPTDAPRIINNSSPSVMMEQKNEPAALETSDEIHPIERAGSIKKTKSSCCFTKAKKPAGPCLTTLLARICCCRSAKQSQKIKM